MKLRGHGPWVAELRESCETVLAAGRALKLGLAEVEFLDTDGVVLLSSLRSRGVFLMDCSPFVEVQLKTATSS